MRIKPSILSLAAATIILVACDPVGDKNDPLRQEVVSACEELKAYSSMKAEKRTSLCECIYDEALRGLSEDEKNAVRFYLLEQAGINARSRNLVSQSSDINVMLNASKAIGKSVKQCR